MEIPHKQRVLVVDDDGSVQVSLALLLKQSGFEVLTCDEPAQVLPLLAGNRVDLVLQDMNFSPRTSGEEGLALLASIKEKHPALPVLLMTAWGSIALAVRGVKIGARGFFHQAVAKRATGRTDQDHTGLGNAAFAGPA
jgi:two-component system NtrC family response regulator